MWGSKSASIAPYTVVFSREGCSRWPAGGLNWGTHGRHHMVESRVWCGGRGALRDTAWVLGVVTRESLTLFATGIGVPLPCGVSRYRGLVTVSLCGGTGGGWESERGVRCGKAGPAWGSGEGAEKLCWFAIRQRAAGMVPLVACVTRVGSRSRTEWNSRFSILAEERFCARARVGSCARTETFSRFLSIPLCACARSMACACALDRVRSGSDLGSDSEFL